MRHPELAAARSNRDYVIQQVSDAVSTISGVAQATGSSQPNPYEGAGELAAALDEFDVSTIILATVEPVIKTTSIRRLSKETAFEQSA